MNRSTAIVTALLLVLLIPMRLEAQRNALGQRLKLLERAWSEKGNEAARRRALPAVNEAVNSFFSFRLAKAAEALDRARFLLEGPTIDPERAHAAGLVARLGPRLVDPAGEGLSVEIASLYEAGTAPTDLVMRAWLEHDGVKCSEVVMVDPATRKALVRSQGKIEAAGRDVDLVIVIAGAERELARIVHAVALVPGIDARLTALLAVGSDAAPKLEPGESPDWRLTSAAALAADLEALRSGKEPEDEPRAAAMLLQAESWVGADCPLALAAGESRLGLSIGNRRFRARVAVPEGVSEKSPLLVLVHGAGGSENMFFEALGGGVYIREGLARGAVVLAPRAPLFGSFDLLALIDAVKPLVPFDDRQVFVVGHSMGAGIALDCARRAPDRFAGIAAIAGGRPLRDPKALVGLPVFLGTGAEDFGRDGLLALAAALGKVEGQRYELVDRPLTEHLLVVQDLVTEVFRFIDGIREKAR